MREYRIRWRLFGWEPQQRYNTGLGGMIWFPLNAEGYWLQPDAYNDGAVTHHVTMPRHDAERAILRARAINQQHIAAQ